MRSFIVLSCFSLLFSVGFKVQATNSFSEHKEVNDLIHQIPFLEEVDTYVNTRKIYTAVRKYYLPVPRHIDNEACKVVVNDFPTDIQNGLSSWALHMADSWGKIPDGFLFGNIHLVGMYEECLLVSSEVKPSIFSDFNETVPFSGKYCTIYYKHNPSSNTSEAASPMESPLVRSGPGMIYFADPLPYNYATCIPSVCTSYDLTVSMNVTLKGTNREIKKIICTDESDDSLDALDIVICTIIGILFSLVVIGTLLDSLIESCNIVIINTDVKRTLFIFRCFSFGETMKKIFKYTKKRSTNEVTCLHGMRAITLIWIITCHQYITGIRYAANTANVSKYQDPNFGQFITNGYPAVDTFFCISGMLLMMRLLPKFRNGEGLHFIGAFFRRVLRLSPSIFLVAGFSATLLRFLGWGPHQWYLKEWSLKECRGNWWKDFLFIDNYVIGDNHGATVNDCLGHCWYTAVDMQLFLISPFILVPLYLKFSYGLIWLGLLTVWSMLIPGLILYTQKLPPLPVYYLTPSQHLEYMTKYYLVPWCRAAPWFVGMWGGLYLVKKPRNFPSSKSILLVISYLMALTIGFSVVLGMYQYNHVGEHNEIKYWLSAIYGAFSRPAWALAVVWIAVTCHEGHGGIVNVILSWWGWQPISRLTFCMYLISPVVQIWWTSVQFIPPYYNYLGKLFETSGVFFISFICAILVSALIERPLLKLTGCLAASSAKRPVVPVTTIRSELATSVL